MMDRDWQLLYDAAKQVIHPVALSDSMEIGSVGAAVLSAGGKI